MIALPEIFRKYGYTFRRLHARPEGFIYAQKNENTGKYIAFEVFARRTAPKRSATIVGNTVVFPARELYPSSSDFGKWAWSFMTEEKALEKLEEISEKARAKAVA